MLRISVYELSTSYVGFSNASYGIKAHPNAEIGWIGGGLRTLQIVWVWKLQSQKP
jgi:hypothetical protein